MTSIITGDIINSKDSSPQAWLATLKSVLNNFGNTPKQWEIYRGDSFQLEIPTTEALRASFLIKATIKQYKNLDVRLAIGIGDKTYASEKITESNGSAFVNSGECFEALKKTTLALKSPFESFDIQINIMLELAQLTTNYWTSTSANLVKIALENPQLNQKALAKKLNKTQGNISQGLKRAGFDELSKLLDYYKTQITTLC
ncbi:transcriptional regulator [uncultured Algibacter sp.]|uniref:transcriptional regulator n=1 Tax=uncultured Algibacter sp. TaxID=298659 RepID=UPI00260E41DC|nr:transcriptional regulator [uncultured Algibacter sp.]